MLWLDTFKDFMLAKEHLHILLATCMLMPFIFFIIFTMIFPQKTLHQHVEEETEEDDDERQQHERDDAELEATLMRELEAFQKRRHEDEERRKEKKLDKINEKRITTIEELEKSVGEIEGFAFDAKRGQKSDMYGLVLNLFSRGIPQIKVAQILKFKFGQDKSEDEVLNLVSAVSDFLSLAKEDTLKALIVAKQLPPVEDALAELADGNPRICLNLLQTIMKQNIENAEKFAPGKERESYLSEASHQACVFGVLAQQNNEKTALKAYELALKLDPQNMVAENLAADIYFRAFYEEEALKRYQEIIQTDNPNYAYQKANAYKNMSLNAYRHNALSKALEYYRAARDFYDELRINTPPTAEEQQVADFLINEQKKNMPQMIQNILRR